MRKKKKAKLLEEREDEPKDLHITHGIDYPVFSFKYLQEDSIKGCKDADFLNKFIIRLMKLSSLGWKEIRKSGRHGFGTEQIHISQIKPKKRVSITEDIDYLTVFRAHGDNRPFLGLNVYGIFHVIYIEANFCDIYDHG